MKINLIISIFLLISTTFVINLSYPYGYLDKDPKKFPGLGDIEICDDGIDNDNDGLIDYNDNLDCFK